MWTRNKKKMHIAKRYISKVSEGLYTVNLRGSNKKILSIYQKIVSVLRSHSKYRLPSNLIPLIFFIYFRLHDLTITKPQLLAVTDIKSADLNDFLMQLKNYLRRDI